MENQPGSARKAAQMFSSTSNLKRAGVGRLTHSACSLRPPHATRRTSCAARAKTHTSSDGALARRRPLQEAFTSMGSRLAFGGGTPGKSKKVRAWASRHTRPRPRACCLRPRRRAVDESHARSRRLQTVALSRLAMPGKRCVRGRMHVPASNACSVRARVCEKTPARGARRIRARARCPPREVRLHPVHRQISKRTAAARKSSRSGNTTGSRAPRRLPRPVGRGSGLSGRGGERRVEVSGIEEKDGQGLNVRQLLLTSLSHGPSEGGGGSPALCLPLTHAQPLSLSLSSFFLLPHPLSSSLSPAAGSDRMSTQSNVSASSAAEDARVTRSRAKAAQSQV